MFDEVVSNAPQHPITQSPSITGVTFSILGKCKTLSLEKTKKNCAWMGTNEKDKSEGYYSTVIGSEPKLVKHPNAKNFYHIKPEKNCYVIVFDGDKLTGDNKEAYVRKDDVAFLQKTRIDELGPHDIEKPPGGRGGEHTCTTYWKGSGNTWPTNYICGWWDDDTIKSYKCECVFDEEEDAFEDKLKDTDEDGKVIE